MRGGEGRRDRCRFGQGQMVGHKTQRVRAHHQIPAEATTPHAHDPVAGFEITDVRTNGIDNRAEFQPQCLPGRLNLGSAGQQAGHGHDQFGADRRLQA